jgi:hypothetical protein
MMGAEGRMSRVTVEIDPETETELRRQADRRGETLESYIGHLVRREADAGADGLERGIDWLTNRTATDLATARSRILAAAQPPRAVPAGTSAVETVEGKWPGTETDAEVRAALDRMS